MLLAWLPTLYFETSLSWWVVGIISKIVLIVLNKLILGIEGEGDIWDAAQVTVLERKHGVNKLGADVGNIIIVVILFGLLNLIYWGF